MFLSDAPSNSSWSSLDKSDDSSRIWSVLLVNRLFLAMVAVIISLRMFTKFFMAMRLFLDDCKAPSSLLLALPTCGHFRGGRAEQENMNADAPNFNVVKS